MPIQFGYQKQKELQDGSNNTTQTPTIQTQQPKPTKQVVSRQQLSEIAIAEKSMFFGEIRGLINFNCMLRTKELMLTDSVESYGNIFKNIPTIGFNTYGEAFLGHINQTSVILIFGS
jgi:hypothetical protein